MKSLMFSSDDTERDNGQWKGISETIASDAPVEVYLMGLDFKVFLVKHVFRKKRGLHWGKVSGVQ